MAALDANRLRRLFTEFFVERGHAVSPSAGLVPHHPTAPMFTNAGMIPFVPYFLGEERPPWKRTMSVQKCVRLSGKHNDIDELGRTRRHLTFFEMLGNWSFGEYFKAEAIAWAWEFLTEVSGFDGDPIWVTVEPAHLGEELPRPRDRFGLEVLTEAPVAEHLEEREVPAGAAQFIDVVVLA